MKLCNIAASDGVHLGIVTARGVIDATAAGYANTLDEVIAGADRTALEALAENKTLPVIAKPEYLNVVQKPGKLICVGLNYRSHASKVDLKSAEVPILFSKFPDSLIPTGAPIELPEWEDSYDYEAELVIVIGKSAWGVSEENAGDYIFGYTCGNDLSCRVPQKRTSQWLIGKAMPGFGPCGPCITTADSIDPEKGIAIKSFVNGELRQDGSTTDMIFSCKKVLSYASHYIKLEPGDLIFTGTPAGVQLEKNSSEAKWLKKGDKVEVEIEGIGTLVNEMA